jgi:hypothetical protein
MNVCSESIGASRRKPVFGQDSESSPAPPEENALLVHGLQGCLRKLDSNSATHSGKPQTARGFLRRHRRCRQAANPQPSAWEITGMSRQTDLGARWARPQVANRLPTCPAKRQAANGAGTPPAVQALPAGRLPIGRRLPTCPTSLQRITRGGAKSSRRANY